MSIWRDTSHRACGATIFGAVLLSTVVPTWAQIDFSVLEPYRGQRGSSSRDSGGSSERWNELSAADREHNRKVDRYKRLFDEANRAGGDGNYREAIRLMREALALFPDEPLTGARAFLERMETWERGMSAFEKKDYAAAEAAFRAYLRLRPNHSGAVQNLAAALEAQGRLGDAIAVVRESLAVREDPELRRWLAEAEPAHAKNEARGKREREARRNTDAAEERSRRNRPQAERLNDEAVALLNAGRAEEALAKFGSAHELAGEDRQISANWWLAKANIAYRQGNIDQTIADLQNALGWDPENRAAAAILQRARAYRDEQRSRIQSAFAGTRDVFNGPTAGASVVDARVSRFGSELMQVAATENSPAAERARKGLQAAANRDWPVALAWWQDALNHDPNNPALRRSVDLASWTIRFREQHGIPPSTPFDAAFDAWSRGETQRALRLMRQTSTPSGPMASAASQIKRNMEELARTGGVPATAPGSTARLTAAALDHLADNMLTTAWRDVAGSFAQGKPVSEETNELMHTAYQLKADAAAIEQQGTLPAERAGTRRDGGQAPSNLEFLTR